MTVSIDQPSQNGSGPPQLRYGVRVWRVDDIPKSLDKIACHKKASELLQVILGEDAEFLSAKAVIKSNEVQDASPWHQDYPYWGGSEKVSLWVAVDDAVPENGCLRVIPGTHLKDISHRRLIEGVEDGFQNRIEEKHLDEAKAISVPLQKGDGLLFSDKLVHCSFPNLSGEDRYSFISTYRDGSIEDTSSVWEISKAI